MITKDRKQVFKFRGREPGEVWPTNLFVRKVLMSYERRGALCKSGDQRKRTRSPCYLLLPSVKISRLPNALQMSISFPPQNISFMTGLRFVLSSSQYRSSSSV